MDPGDGVLNRNHRISALCLVGLCGGLLLVSQVVLAFLPNFELVSLLVILFTRFFRKLVIPAIGVFVLLEGLLYGFGIWWISYLYVWYVLALLTWCFRRRRSLLFWAVFSGGFGLAFGSLTAIPYLWAGDAFAAISYIVTGIPFDLIHGGGNFLLALVLCRPLERLLESAAVGLGVRPQSSVQASFAGENFTGQDEKSKGDEGE